MSGDLRQHSGALENREREVEDPNGKRLKADEGERHAVQAVRCLAAALPSRFSHV